MPYTRGQRLELARKRRGLTQQQLAELSGVAQNVISEIENDKRPQISVTIFEKLADALGKPVDYFLKGCVYDGERWPPGAVETAITAAPGRLTD